MTKIDNYLGKVEITTTFSIDLGIEREVYIREAILGDYTSFSIRRSYLKFECQESLEAFVTLLSRNLCNILIFSTNIE